MTNELVTAIQGTRATLDEKMETSEVKLFSDTAPITAEQLNRCVVSAPITAEQLNRCVVSAPITAEQLNRCA